MAPRRKIGEVLVDLGFLTDEQIQEALQQQKKGKELFGATLLRLKMVTRIQLDEALKDEMSDLA